MGEASVGMGRGLLCFCCDTSVFNKSEIMHDCAQIPVLVEPVIV